MDCSDSASKKAKSATGSSVIRRRPRVLLAACGSVAAVKFGHVCRCFAEWAEVRAVVTKSSLRFISAQTFPTDIHVFWDDNEWNTWKRIGDRVVHIELNRWAEIMVIAPLSANTLGKVIKLTNFAGFISFYLHYHVIKTSPCIEQTVWCKTGLFVQPW